MCISKEKAVCHYVDLNANVFEENSKITQCVCLCVCVCGGGGFECQLRTPKGGVCLDQNWIFVDRREEGVGVRNLDFFRRHSVNSIEFE